MFLLLRLLLGVRLVMVNPTFIHSQESRQKSTLLSSSSRFFLKIKFISALELGDKGLNESKPVTNQDCLHGECIGNLQGGSQATSRLDWLGGILVIVSWHIHFNKLLKGRLAPTL